MDKIALCCIVKNENKYLKEYIEYYLNIGFDDIIFIDNNDTESLDEFKSEHVIIENYRNQLCPQIRAYTEIYNKYSQNYSWIAFFDADEYLTLLKYKDVRELLNDEKYNKFDSIRINWLMFSDNNQIYYEDLPVTKRFTSSIPNTQANAHIKVIMKTNLKFVLFFNNPHYMTGNYSACNMLGNKVENQNSPFEYNYYDNYEVGYLKHFYTKSCEEWLQKINRGRADINIKREIDDYFNYNVKTKEKEDFFSKKPSIF